MEKSYIAFISYRHTPLDSAVAKQLHGLIESYIIPHTLRVGKRRKLGLVFRDKEELAASSDLSQDICKALDASAFLIVVCTPDTAGSIWVNREIQYFLRSHDRSHILAVLADGEPKQAFPDALIHDCDASGTKIELEPLAMDVRAHGVYNTKRKVAKECKRLFAAILGCPYDALVLREQRRKFKKAAIAIVMVWIVAAGFTSLLLVKNKKIQQQNIALAEEKVFVQHQQAQLLTEIAQESLRVGNNLAAARDAVKALRLNEEAGQPYYAPAETILFDAVNLFGNNTILSSMYDTTLEQTTPVSDFDISDDGEKIVTIDPYGTIQCFDTVDGTHLWSSYVHKTEYFIPFSFSQDTERVRVFGQQNAVLAFYHGGSVCCNLGTGETIWKRDLGCIPGDCIFYSSGQDAFLCLERTADDFGEITSVNLNVISAGTGELLKSIAFPQVESFYCCEFPYRWGPDFPLGGVFTPDGNTFYSVFVEYSKDLENAVLKFYSVDLKKEQAAVFYQRDITSAYGRLQVSGVQLADQGASLMVTLYNNGEIVIEKFDIDSKSQLWHTSIPVDSSSLPYCKDVLTQIWSKSMYVACENQIHCLSIETGELLDTAELPSNVTELYTTSNTTIGFFLEDGTYAIGWKSPSGLLVTTDPGLEVFASIGRFSVAKCYGGGVLQRYDDGNLVEVSISNQYSEGYAAVVPSDNKQSVIVKRPSEKLECIEAEEVTLPIEVSSISSPSCIYGDEEKLILGPFQKEDTYYYFTMDLDSHRLIKTYKFDTESYDFHPFFMADESTYLLIEDGKSIIRNTDGVDEQLASTETESPSDDCYLSFRGLNCCDAAYLAGSQTVLTANLGMKTLTVWIDSDEVREIPLPEKYQFDLDTYDSHNRFLKVGSNGDIVLSTVFPVRLSDIAIYQSGSNKWILPTLDTVVSRRDILTISARQPVLAFVDEQDTVWIYNYAEEEMTASFPLCIPYDSIADMQFLLDDTYMVLKTNHDLVIIYDLATGTILYRSQLTLSQYEGIHAVVDDANDRLYLFDAEAGEKSGVCIDLKTWSNLFTIDNMLFFDAVRGEICQHKNGDSLFVRQVPGTSQLITLLEPLLAPD